MAHNTHMGKRTVLALLTSHFAVAGLGFALGIYLLPILIAPDAPGEARIREMSAQAEYSGEFRRDLQGSDVLHWGEGEVSVGPKFVTLIGSLAPGPDYKLYLSTEFVETESDFHRLKPKMVRVGDVRTFDNFAVELPAGVDPFDYNSVVVWCETFGRFITAAQYKD